MTIFFTDRFLIIRYTFYVLNVTLYSSASTIGSEALPLTGDRSLLIPDPLEKEHALKRC